MSNLFALIHSLTPSEKRYFKLFAQRQVQSKSTNYCKLFDAINDQEMYNELDLLKKFRRETFVKQFAVTKNYLFQMILQSMEEYNEENYIEWKVRNQYLQIKILASKGLDADAEKLIKKTKEMAWANELYNVILDVMDIEKYLYGNFRIGEATFEAFDLIQKEESKAASIAINYQELRNVWHWLTLLELQVGALTQEQLFEKAKAFVQVPCMQHEPPISYNSKFRYYSTWSLYYGLINNQELNYECCKKGVFIREEQIAHQPWLNMDPLASYYNFLMACEKANKWDEFEFYLQKIKDYKAVTIEVNIRRMHNYCWCGLMYYLYQKNYIAAKGIMHEYKSFFIEGNIAFRKDFKMYIEAACGLVCFFNKDYKQALHWWSYILNGTPVSVELRTQGAVRLYVVMLHFEEGNYDILDYVIKQAKNYLKQNNLLKEPEQMFIKTIAQIAGIIHPKDRRLAFDNLYEKMCTYPLSLTANAFNKFVLNWIQDKCTAI